MKARSRRGASGEQFFVGRHAEIERFHRLLSGQAPHQVLSVYGPGGIGKTVVCRKLAEHAAVQGVPVATVDGSHPGLTADQILHRLAAGITAGTDGKGMSKWFDAFGREFQDFLAVNSVLQRGGGVSAVFEAMGKAKDPLGFAALLGGLGSAVTDSVRRTLSNRFAVERYLRGAEQTLAQSFRDGLIHAYEDSGKPIALLLDGYEDIEGLDDWVCRTLVPALPERAYLVILGRNAVHQVNMDWADLGDRVLAIPLPELSADDAKTYLRHYGLTDSIALEKVWQFTGGYPLLLVLVRQLAAEAGGWDQIGTLEQSADRDRVATQLLERILDEERVVPLRQFLEKGVLARWFDPQVVRVVLDVGSDEARAIYDQLRRHSFVERHPYGLRFHDKVRQLLEDRLQFGDSGEYRRIQKLLIAHYAERAGLELADETPTLRESAGGDMQEPPST